MEASGGERQSRRTRLAVLPLLVLAAAATFWLGMAAISATSMGIHAGLAAISARSAAGQVAQPGAALDHLANVRRHAAAAHGIASGPWMSALRVLPVWSGLARDLEDTTAAASSLADASDEALELLVAAKGLDGRPAVVNDGNIDVAGLPRMGPDVRAVSMALSDAEPRLSRVGRFPGTSWLSGKSLEYVTPARRLAAAADGAWGELPTALGSKGPRQYLVAILNPAELFPTGGAPLSVMLLRFDNGKMTIPTSGQISTAIFPRNPPVSWEHIAGPPYYETPTAKAPFVNSNLHPDFTVSGEEMARSWEASKAGRVDGVITVDMTALAAIIDRTGPVPLGDGDTLTSDNLVDKLLVDSYRKRTSLEDTVGEHKGYSRLMQAMTERFRSPKSLGGVVGALMSVDGDRHFQAFFRSAALQKEAHGLGVDGSLSPPADSDDHFAFFTTSSPNKIAIFQDRRIERTVTLAADGSANVSERITIRNGVPWSEGTKTGAGYRDVLMVNYYAAYLPMSARGARLTLTGGIPHLAGSAVRTSHDADGRPFLWGASGADPGDAVVLDITYELPAGTFSAEDARLRYVSTADPQPMWTKPSLSVRVLPPDGFAADGSANGWSRDGDGYLRDVTFDRREMFELSLGR